MSLVHASSFQASVLTLPGGKDGVLPTGVLQMSIICWLLLTMVVAVIDYWLEGKNKLCFRIINVRNWRFSFNSLFCHRFPWEDLISQCLSSSHKTWPVFHSDAEWIPWKGRSLWDAQSTQHPCQPRRALPWRVMASGCPWDCFACPWNATPQPSGEATRPSETVKSSWKWAIS